MFKSAIVRTPCKNFVNSLSSSNLGKPDYELALKQHQDYIKALQSCGVKVLTLPSDMRFPDSTFVEDTAIVTSSDAIVTNPGASSRKGEVNIIKEQLQKYFPNLSSIKSPGTLDGGDVMQVRTHFYIGLSDRTNKNGAEQLINILKNNGFTASTLKLENVLHLKSGVAYLQHNNLVTSGEFISKREFKKFDLIEVDVEENYAANCLWVNGSVLIVKGFPKIKEKIMRRGYKIIELDMSEFRKADGGLSCLSLRF